MLFCLPVCSLGMLERAQFQIVVLWPEKVISKSALQLAFLMSFFFIISSLFIYVERNLCVNFWSCHIHIFLI